MNSLSKLVLIEDRVSRFRELCLLYRDFVKAEGVTVRPFLDPSVPSFAGYPFELQEQVLQAIATDLEIFQSVHDEGESLRDNPKLIWRYMNRMGLVPQSDIFDKIENEDVIEIYLVDHTGQRQIFRNLRFLECVSYSVDQLFGADWRMMSSREDQYSKKIYDCAIAIMSGQVTTTLGLESLIEEHEVLEIDSPELFTLMIQMRYISPIKQNGRVAGALTINRTRVVGRRREWLEPAVF